MEITRRHFVSTLAGIGMLSASGLSLRAKELDNDYKALVCIDLKGGNDASNMLIPTSQEHYQLYQSVRSHLAVSKDKLISLKQQAKDEKEKAVSLGLHPEMTALAPLFNTGKANAIINCGILEQPLTKQEILSGTKKKPPQLFSHNSQSREWHKGAVNNPTKLGWAGRMMDILSTSEQQMSPLYSLSGNVSWLTAENSVQNILNGSKIINQVGMKSPHVRSSLTKLTAKHSTSPFHAEINRIMNAAVHNRDLLATTISSAKELAYFSDNPFSQKLNTVFKLVSQHKALKQNRQIFYVSLAGFDTHDDQAARQPILLKQLSEGIAAFYQALDVIGMGGNVATFTMSDFGRRVAPNDSGTDHGWGSHQIVINGALKANQAIGIWPDLTLNGKNDISKGRLIPTIATDQVGATLAKWMGVKNSQEMRYVFPNIGNFERQYLDFL